MSNRTSSKQHCFVGNIRPKSKLRKRKNKRLAAQRREARRAEQQKRLEAAMKAIA